MISTQYFFSLIKKKKKEKGSPQLIFNFAASPDVHAKWPIQIAIYLYSLWWNWENCIGTVHYTSAFIYNCSCGSKENEFEVLLLFLGFIDIVQLISILLFMYSWCFHFFFFFFWIGMYSWCLCAIQVMCNHNLSILMKRDETTM